MNAKLKGTMVLAVFAAVTGCDVVVQEHPHYYRPAPVVVAQPAPVVVAQPPAYVEEGAVVNGVVVQPPAAVDGYVWVNDGWFYWDPGFSVWVHAHRPGGWRPPPTVRVYHTWAEHPMYRPAVVARPAPVVAAPAPVVARPPVVVAAPPPAFVEEGAVVGGVVVAAPAAVDGYVSIGGSWYYWHPKLRVWVHAHRARDWHPAANVHIYHDWAEHPMYHR